MVIESVNEFLSTPADAPLAAMIKTLTRLGHVVIAEGETSALGGAWPLLAAVKSARAGLALQPEQGDGVLVYKTDFPRAAAANSRRAAACWSKAAGSACCRWRSRNEGRIQKGEREISRTPVVP